MQMADNENKYLNDIDNVSGTKLAMELGRLLLLLLWKIVRKGIRIAARFLLFVLESAHDGWERLVEWWHDKDTQEKVAEIRSTLARWSATFAHWCVVAFWLAAKWLKIAAIATMLGTVAALKATAVGIVHLRTTTIRLSRLTVKATKATAAWLKLCWRGTRLWLIRRRRAYQRFRRNKGFKGLLIDTTNAVSNGIAMFMEEDQQEAAPDAVTEDDLLIEQIEAKVSDDNVAAKFGQRLFMKAKDITEGAGDTQE